MSADEVVKWVVLGVAVLLAAAFILVPYLTRPKGNTCPRCQRESERHCHDVRLPPFHWICPACYIQVMRRRRHDDF